RRGVGGLDGRQRRVPVVAVRSSEGPPPEPQDAFFPIAFVNLGRAAAPRRALGRGFQEVPPRALGPVPFGMAYASMVFAQVPLAMGDHGQAMSAVRQALLFSEQSRARLEEGASHRVLGQIHAAMGDKADADAAFRRSLDLFQEIQSRPELA